MSSDNSRNVDEETPLLRPTGDAVGKPRQETPIPWRQFSLVLFLQVSEPLTSQVIFPFLPQLIRDVGVTHGDDTQVGYYVGIMQSLFFATEAVTVLHWSRASDRVGRKPILLFGLFGLALSMFCFGLSRSFWALVVSRSLAGALNGNIGVMKSIIGELTDETNIARTMGYQPIAWSTGSAIGPLIGGSLSRPAERFPSLFGASDFLKAFPYFLPCAISGTFSVIAWIVTFRYLKETNPTGFSLRTLLSREKAPEPHPTEPPVPLRSLLTRRVLVAAGNYALLSFVSITFRALLPVFLATPLALGGLGLAPPAIGSALAAVGVGTGAFQVFLFARVHAWLGARRCYLLGISAALPMIALFPLLGALARARGVGPVVWTALGVQLALTVLLNMCFGCVFIYITAAAPSRRTLGATNGLTQVSVSIMRAIGPAAANSLYSLSLERGYLGGQLVYAVLMLCACGAIAVGTMLPREVWRRCPSE